MLAALSDPSIEFRSTGVMSGKHLTSWRERQPWGSFSYNEFADASRSQPVRTRTPMLARIEAALRAIGSTLLNVVLLPVRVLRKLFSRRG
jgi:hypothetical protein